MTRHGNAGDIARLLTRFASGSLRAEVEGRPVLTLDAGRQEVEVQIDPFLTVERKVRAVAPPQAQLHLWEARGLPSTLARSGWKVVFQDGPRELIRMGRGVSPLTGHVWVSPAGLWKMRRLR